MILASRHVSNRNKSIATCTKTAKAKRESYRAMRQLSSQIAFVKITASNKRQPNRTAHPCFSANKTSSATMFGNATGTAVPRRRSRDRVGGKLCHRAKIQQSRRGGPRRLCVTFVQFFTGWDTSETCRKGLRPRRGLWLQPHRFLRRRLRPNRRRLRQSNQQPDGILPR